MMVFLVRRGDIQSTVARQTDHVLQRRGKRIRPAWRGQNLNGVHFSLPIYVLALQSPRLSGLPKRNASTPFVDLLGSGCLLLSSLLPPRCSMLSLNFRSAV